MRILIKSLTRDAYQFKHVSSLLHSFFFLQVLMDHDGFCYLLTDCKYRVKSCHRILEDHRNLFSSDLFQRCNGHCPDILAINFKSIALNDSWWVRNQAEHSKSCCCLSCSCLTYQSQCLLVTKLQIDAVYCIYNTVFSLKSDS